MAPIALNMDILLAILSHSATKTATSIMATCRFLYHEGAKVILRKPIFLDLSERDDLALLRFIQAEDLSRCSYVRNLTILTHTRRVSKAVAGILLNIVPRMSNLVYLCLGEPLFTAFPYLLPAFASLRSIKTLTLREAGDKSCELVRNLQSELVAADIQFAYSFTASSHPIHLLRRSASTLQKVECLYWYDTPTNIETVMSSPKVIYPNVRNLVLRNHRETPCLLPYFQAFPNLVHLRVEGDCSVPEEFLSSVSRRNQDQINIALRVLIKEPLLWEHIETYTGTLPTLRALRITFPIPRLYLTTLPHDPTQFVFTEVFAFARPIHFTISFEDQAFSGHICREFLAALRSDGASGLQSLSFTIEVMAADVDSNFDIGQFWASIETIFSRMPLCNVDIVMRDISLPKTASTALRSSDGEEQRALIHEHTDTAAYGLADSARLGGAPSLWLSPYSRAAPELRAAFTLAERTLEDFDVRAFVGRLSASIPTLRNAVISVARPSRWSDVMRTGRLDKHDDKSESLKDVNVADHVLYEEYREELSSDTQRRGQGWASLTRAWNRGVQRHLGLGAVS